MTSLRISSKHTEKLCPSFSNYDKGLKRREHTQNYFSMKPHYPDTKTRQRNYKKRRKLQASVFNEYRCKSLQQDISKPNLAIGKKDHTPLSSWIQSTVAKIVQQVQINQHDATH